VQRCKLTNPSAGAAGNFLAPMDQISPNAMKSVIDIDVLGSYNTVKATLPYLIESASKHRTNGHTQPASGTGGRIIFVSATLHYSGTPLQAHVSVAKAGVDAMAVSVAIEQVSATGLCNSKLFFNRTCTKQMPGTQRYHLEHHCSRAHCRYGRRGSPFQAGVPREVLQGNTIWSLWCGQGDC
jgi:NADP-dependent 3-hydroxy acid dehydrogenase YdfG